MGNRSVLLALLALCANRVAVAGQRLPEVRLSAAVGDECTGPGSERHDYGTHYLASYWSIGSSPQPICDAYDVYSGNVAQLFTPPSVPWKYTRICFAMRLMPLANKSIPLYGSVQGAVSLYPVTVSSAGVLTPGDRLATATFARDIEYTPPARGAPKGDNNNIDPVWFSVDVSGVAAMAAWDKGVFIGVNYWSCDLVEAIGVHMPWSRRHYVREYNGWWDESKQCDAWLIRTMGHNHTVGGAPQGWYCNKTKYNDGKCDCNCGAGDVDCNTDFTGCGAGSVCDQTGRCVALDWSRYGVCSPSNYWQYDGCQCECGSVIDPDCLDYTAPVTQCEESLFQPACKLFQDGPFCVDQWKCNRSLYNDGKVCNCNCGAPDPDCDNHSLDTDCMNNFICMDMLCVAPREWKCNPDWYNSKDECDCECGAYDPDCDIATKEVLNCSAGQVCNYDGKCVAPGCGNDRVDLSLNEQCDHGVGCLPNCSCGQGYHAMSPVSLDCQTQCGDTFVAGSEECDSGKFCTNCSCDAGHAPYNGTRRQYCTGCGNGELDAFESCDSGLGCDGQCRCTSGYAPTSPLSLACVVVPKESKSSNKKVIISSTVGSVCGFLLIVAVIAALLYARKVKYGPRKLNLPLEMNSGITSVDINCVPVQEQSLEMSSASPLATFVSSDGLVYVTSNAVANSSVSASPGAGAVLPLVAPPPSAGMVQLPDGHMVPASTALALQSAAAFPATESLCVNSASVTSSAETGSAGKAAVASGGSKQGASSGSADFTQVVPVSMTHVEAEPKPFRGSSVIGNEKELLEGSERDLWTKLRFASSALGTVPTPDDPLAGKRMLEERKGRAEQEGECQDSEPGVDLLMALEYDSLNLHQDALAALGAYAEALRKSQQLADPLVLLAAARILLKGDTARIGLCISDLRKAVPPDSLDKWLTAAEKQASLSCSPSVGCGGGVGVGGTRSDDPHKARWEELKGKGCCSDAIEKLLAMSGLRRVKDEALRLMQSGLAFRGMDAAQRKRNLASVQLNYTFLGAPGTGKTTVAELFAAILKDAGLMTSGSFVRTSGATAKDKGADEFRKLVGQASNGVLFVDEAYQLDPANDPRGTAIADELLVLAEDRRSELSIVLCGYRDEMDSKLCSYNAGFSSRFKEVAFENMSDEELGRIWDAFVSEGGWTTDGKVRGVVLRRLARMRSQPGFANARDVRNLFGKAISSAMQRSADGQRCVTVEDVIGEPPLKNPRIREVLGEIDGKIGWGAVKKSARELVALANTNYELEVAGKPTVPFFANRLFLGNPGTGKTTAARLYGRLLKELHVLSKGDSDVVEKMAVELKGSAVGESERNTVAVLEAARGKVLTIDEAYVLDDSQYGKCVLDTIVAKLPPEDIAVLLMGYEKPMLEMIRKQNPGLDRRFPPAFAFRFEDYTLDELRLIFMGYCESRGFEIGSRSSGCSQGAVVEKVLDALAAQKLQSKNFGNAGAVENLIKEAGLKAATRGHPIVLLPEDIAAPAGRRGASSDPFGPLKELRGAGDIIERLRALQKQLEVAKREGTRAARVPHMVFRGNPGTGKTTVARCIAALLNGVGLLPTDRIEETSGQKLTGEYVGHTKAKVVEAMERAKGAVLFIDEAYTLSHGLFGKEAADELVAGMTSEEYKGMVVIVAGYPAEMDRMLDTNPGLKGRFTEYVDFKDWEASDCAQYVLERARRENFGIEEGVEARVLKGFGILRRLRGFANARDAVDVWEEITKCRAVRVFDKTGAPRTICVSDAVAALKKKIKSRDLTDEQVIAKVVGKPVRDAGISEAALKALLQAQRLKEEGIRKLLQERERRRKELEELMKRQKRERETAELLAAIKAAQEEKERAVAAVREAVLKEQRTREALARICPCPAGFSWFKVDGGWRCAGGSHFVSDSQLPTM
eukprot:m51a1_g7236 hypothetical protein (1904) ;mRNA; r:85545-94889